MLMCVSVTASKALQLCVLSLLARLRVAVSVCVVSLSSLASCWRVVLVL